MNTEFQLIETMLWEKGEYFLLDLHLARLSKSAVYFDCQLEKEALLEVLSEKAALFDPEKQFKVRLLLEKSGKFSLTSEDLDKTPETPVKVTLSDKYIDKNDTFFYHKTTNRELYNREFKRHRDKGFFDVLFMNKSGEITEGSITNVLISKGDEYFTPPVSCGLLPGTFREHLFLSGEIDIKEKGLYVEDLQTADQIFICNSVSKLLPAVLTV